MIRTQYLIYARDVPSDVRSCPVRNLPEGYSLHVWRPSLCRILPNGVPLRKYPYFVFLWIIHSMDNLKGRGYEVYLVRRNGRLVHYSGVAPKCFKYRFMNEGDLIIGPVLTMPDDCRKGIAKTVIEKIVMDKRMYGSCLWYVTRKNNNESRALMSSCKFACKGNSHIKRILGMRVHDISCDKIREVEHEL